MSLVFIRNFLKFEAMGGLLLFFAAMLALIISNSSLALQYQALFSTPLDFQLGTFYIAKPLLFWINEGLMTLFFLLVGLELKREFLEGELAGISKIVLPGFAALGGMLIPACLYIAINWYHPETLKGWAIPLATDIAFALGVLSLFGKRVPVGLKLFLMALAIFDDIGAIIIIAFIHMGHLSYMALFLAGVVLVFLLLLNQVQVRNLMSYILLGIALWLCILQSGVHATIAGVLLAFMIPFSKIKGEVSSPAYCLEKALHPWVVFLIMPIFALANAGVSFVGLESSTFFSSLTLGVVVGLVIGKQVGVFSFSWAIIRWGWATLPEKTDWWQIYGVALLCGIGFTMSLFLGTLAFEHNNSIYLTEVRLGVLLGSTLSGVIGALVLYSAFQKQKRGSKT